jgi:hypothetical protein
MYFFPFSVQSIGSTAKTEKYEDLLDRFSPFPQLNVNVTTVKCMNEKNPSYVRYVWKGMERGKGGKG